MTITEDELNKYEKAFGAKYNVASPQFALCGTHSYNHPIVDVLIAEIRRLREENALFTAREIVSIGYGYNFEQIGEFKLLLRCLDNDLLDRTIQDIKRLIALGKAVEAMEKPSMLVRCEGWWTYNFKEKWRGNHSSYGKQTTGDTPFEALEKAKEKK